MLSFGAFISSQRLFIFFSVVFSLCEQRVFGFQALNPFRQYSRIMSMSSALSNVDFVKYQGLGNDFILVDNTRSTSPVYSSQQAVHLCDRNFGIGADGVIFALPGENGCDYTMRIYNSDGSEPQMCGNGIRCMAKFLQEIENKNNQNTKYKIWTNAGLIVPEVKADGSITVDMGEPILNPSTIPTTLTANNNGKVIEADIEALGKVYKCTPVSMGNPHCVSYFPLFSSI